MNTWVLTLACTHEQHADTRAHAHTYIGISFQTPACQKVSFPFLPNILLLFICLCVKPPPFLFLLRPWRTSKCFTHKHMKTHKKWWALVPFKAPILTHTLLISSFYPIFFSLNTCKISCSFPSTRPSLRLSPTFWLKFPFWWRLFLLCHFSSYWSRFSSLCIKPVPSESCH